MNIGITGPIDIKRLRLYFNKQSRDKRQFIHGLGGTAVTQLVIGLLDKGINVIIFTLDKMSEEMTLFEGDNIKVYVMPYRLEGCGRDFYRKEIKYLTEAMKLEKMDIIHAHWTYEFAIAALHSSTPSLITVRDWTPLIFKMKPSLYWLVRMIMNIYTLFKGKNFTANSIYIQEKMKSIGFKNVPVIPNAFSDDIFYKKERKLNLISPKIISINNEFGKRKNVTTLFRAYKLIRSINPHIKLVLVGPDYSEYGIAHNWAIQNNLAENVVFAGYKTHDEVLTMLEEADVLIHPSMEESFGNTLVEAMAKKTPVIGGIDSGAVPWVLNYGKAGLLVDVNSPELIARTARELLSNSIMWNKLSEACYGRAFNSFRISIVTNNYIEEYKKILA